MIFEAIVLGFLWWAFGWKVAVAVFLVLILWAVVHG